MATVPVWLPHGSGEKQAVPPPRDRPPPDMLSDIHTHTHTHTDTRTHRPYTHMHTHTHGHLQSMSLSFILGLDLRVLFVSYTMIPSPSVSVLFLEAMGFFSALMTGRRITCVSTS